MSQPHCVVLGVGSDLGTALAQRFGKEVIVAEVLIGLIFDKAKNSLKKVLTTFGDYDIMCFVKRPACLCR